MSKIDVAINPETGNPVVRTLPEHRIKRVYAKQDNIVVVGMIGDQEVENCISRSEAIHRAQALSSLIEKQKYTSDKEETLKIVEMFVEAVRAAKAYTGKPYKSTSVSMAGINKHALN